MTEIQLSLINFPHREFLSTILSDFSNDFKFTANGIFRRISPPLCPECGSPMRQKSGRDYKAWIKEAKHAFQDFVHNLELKRRREDGKLEQRSYHDALNNFKCLMKELDSFEMAVRKRLMKIEELWPNRTAFYFVDNAPATNNPIENYYSTSLKTHRKKQLQEPGIEDQMKLSALKRSGFFARPERTLLEVIIPSIKRAIWCSLISFPNTPELLSVSWAQPQLPRRYGCCAIPSHHPMGRRAVG